MAKGRPKTPEEAILYLQAEVAATQNICASLIRLVLPDEDSRRDFCVRLLRHAPWPELTSLPIHQQAFSDYTRRLVNLVNKPDGE